MIQSIGVDIVEIERIENTINKWGDSFLNKVLTPNEYAYCRQKAGLAASVAARFAVKEAVYKALPDSFQQRAGWRDIEVINEPSGKPRVQLNGQLSAALKDYSVHVSLSHGHSSAVAMVVLEKKELER